MTPTPETHTMYARTVAYMAMVNREAVRRNHLEGYEGAKTLTRHNRAAAQDDEARQWEDDILEALDGMRRRDRFTALDATRYRQSHPDETRA
jgi:hypothetical protein